MSSKKRSKRTHKTRKIYSSSSFSKKKKSNNNNNFVGGGILFTVIDKKTKELKFLLGRENKYCINGAYKYCDFGGGNDGENILENVSREASEETMGYFGNKKDIKKMFDRYGTFYIDNINPKNNKVYRIFFLPFPTKNTKNKECNCNDNDLEIIEYYNNSQKVLENYLPKNLLKKSKIFEKDKIEWFTINDLKKRKNELREFFKISSEQIIMKENDIKKFITRGYLS
jgi:hypothetical protein